MKSAPNNQEIVVKKDELLELQRLVERQNMLNNQTMMLKDLMIKFASEYPDVVKNYYQKYCNK